MKAEKEESKIVKGALLTLMFSLLLFLGFLIYLIPQNPRPRGSDRAACILNIRNIHQAVRAHQLLEGYEIGDPIEWSDIFSTETEEKYLNRPTCPCGGDYILVEEFPPKGTPAVSCEHADSKNHRPEDTTGW